MTAKVRKSMEFDAGHRVPDHKSQCWNIHGHRYRFTVEVEGEVKGNDSGSESGMVLDFARIKRAMSEIADKLDHSLILWDQDPFLPVLEGMVEAGRRMKIVRMPWPPTAERLALFIGAWLSRSIDGITLVEVQETPTSVAVVRGPFGVD